MRDQLRILAFAQNDWSGNWMNRQQILSRLGRRHSVAYSQGLRTVWNFRNDIFSGPFLGSRLAHDSVLIDTAPRWLVRWPGREAIDNTVLHFGGARYNKLLRSMGSSGPRILYIFHPSFRSYIDHIEYDLLAYHAYDLFSAAPGWDARSAQDEQELVARADVRIASSAPIARELQFRYGKPFVVIGNGVDFAAFDRCPRTASESDDISSIPHPRIGYVGRVNMKVDLQLIDQLAERMPAWHFPIVGPVESLTPDLSLVKDQLDRRHNVHFLGPKPRDQLPAYMHALDVGIMCYETDMTWAKFGYPLKLHEYLACGLPVVSAKLDALHEFKDTIFLADSLNSWINGIENSLSRRSHEWSEQRRDVARRNSWDQRVIQLEKTIQTCLLA